jgi:hypothetical protein
MLEFGKAADSFVRCGLVARPFDDRRRTSRRLGQRHFPHKAFQSAVTVEQDLLFGKQSADFHDRRVDDPQKGYRRRHGNRKQCSQNKREHAPAQAGRINRPRPPKTHRACPKGLSPGRDSYPSNVHR